MRIWSNTKTLDGLVDDLSFTDDNTEADVALIGGKAIDLNAFPRLKGIFKCGVGRDNVPESEAAARRIRCGFPSVQTADIIFEETACFACHLILKCLYANVGDFDGWKKVDRTTLSKRKILIVGAGNIGGRVIEKMKPFATVMTYDIVCNRAQELEPMIRQADCVSLHMPLNDDTRGWYNAEKLTWMRDGASLVNTARAAIVPENDLYAELTAGRIRAAFDVFWQEPYKGMMLELPPDRFITSPHVASTCNEFITETAKDFRGFVETLDAT